MISIVIPTYNEEKYIEEMLRQFSEIKSVPVEIIVSDNKSEDATVDLARKYAQHVIKNHDAVHATIALTRNRGATQAKYPLIMFVDSAVTIPHIDSFFKHVVRQFEERPRCVGLTVKLGVMPSVATFADRLIFGAIDWWFWVSNNYLKRGMSHGKFMVVRADAFKKVGGFNAKLAAGEDIDFFSRLAKVGETFFDRALVVYHPARRAHKIGWPKLLSIWVVNGFTVLFLKRSSSKEWKDVR